MQKGITRRSALAGAAVFGLAGLASCSKQDGGQAGAEAGGGWSGGYLPIGSAVRLAGMPEGFEHVVVSRRPARSGADGVRDYALIQAVLGLTSDLAGEGGLYAGELVLADEADIAEVVHVGRVTDEEGWAEELLAAGRGTDETGSGLLLPLIESRAEKLGGEDAGR